MKTKCKVLLDLGNSATRVKAVTKKGSKFFELSNQFAVIPEGYCIPEEYINAKNTFFRVEGVQYAHGDIVQKEFKTTLIRPTGLMPKVEQLASRLAFIRAYIEVLRYVGEVYSLPVNAVELDIELGVLLPPLQYLAIKEKGYPTDMELLSTPLLVQEVEEGETTIRLKYVKAKPIPEGLAAYIAACFEVVDGGITEKLAEFTEGYTLVIDIGAGTSDIVLLDGGGLIYDSIETLPIGCTNIKNTLDLQCRKTYSFADDTIAPLITGYLMESGEAIDIVKEVEQAKVKMLEQFNVQLVKYLENLNIAVQQIKGLLVVGGGAVPIVRDGVVVSPALSTHIYKEMQRYAPKIKNIGEYLNKEQDLRELNIEGLECLAHTW